jgi:toxin ParE1/3/4
VKVDFSPDSVADLLGILDYISQQNPAAARKLVDRLEAACLNLAKMPNIGTMRDDLASGLRAFSQGNYIIYFLRTPTSRLRIVRIMHGARDVQPADFRPPQ